MEFHSLEYIDLYKGQSHDILLDWPNEVEFEILDIYIPMARHTYKIEAFSKNIKHGLSCPFSNLYNKDELVVLSVKNEYYFQLHKRSQDTLIILRFTRLA